MKSLYILYYGILVGYLAGFVTSLIQAYHASNTSLIVWPFLKVALGFFLLKLVLNRIEEDMLPRISWLLIATNFIDVAIALWFVWLPSNYGWLATSTRFVGIALGLPSFFALCYFQAKRTN